MSDDAGRPAGSARGGGRRRALGLAAGLALALAGTAAVAVGVLDQDEPPARPPAATSTSAPGPSRPSPPAPAPDPASSPPPAVQAPEQPLPVAISVPSIGVESELITVGLRPDGSLEVPEGADYDKAAWYDGSPRPGAVGPAVIEGHVDSAEGGPSVFYRLGEVEPGDEVHVVREDGSEVTFRVDDVQAYPKDDFPTLDVYGNTPGPALRLITCGGDFDRASGHYLDNTVVYASAMVQP